MARNNVQTTVHVGMDVQLAKRNAEALKEVIVTLKNELKQQRAIMESPINMEAYNKASEAVNRLTLQIQTLQKVQRSATPASAYESFISGDVMNSNTLRQATRGAKNRLNTVPVGASDQTSRTFINDINRATMELNRLQAGFSKPLQSVKKELNDLSGNELNRLLQLLKQEQQLVQGNEKAWASYSAAIAKVEERMREYDTVARQQMGASTLSKAQSGGFATANERDMQRAIDKLKEYRAVINDPNGSGKATYEATNAEIQKLQANLDVLKQKELEATGQSMSRASALQIGMQTLNGTFTGTTQQLNLAKQALEANILTVKRGGAEYNAMRQALNGIELELKNVGQLSAEVQAVLDQPKGKSFNALKQAVEQGRLALNAMDRSTKEGQKRFEELAAKVKAADIEMKNLAGSSKGTASAFDKAWSRLKTYVGLYVGAAVAMQKLTAAMGDLMTLSDKMGEVRKTTGFTADEVGRLSGNLAKLDTRTSLTQLMELSSLAGSVGLKTQEQVQGFTEAADQLIVALPELGNESARTIIKIANATGDLEKNGGNVRETLEKVGSTIIALRANSASAAGPITDFVSRVGAVGAQAGISIDQIAALGSTIDALGGRVEMSATALSRMIPAIKNNSFAIANSIGVTEKYLKSLAPMEQMVLIFQKMRDNIAGIDTTTEQGQEQMAATIEGMLGKNATMREVMKDLEQQGARAGIVFGLLSQNVDELQKQLGIASEAYRENTALANEFNNMNETTAAKWERLKNQFEEAFVGDEAQRMLGGIIDGMRKIVDLLTGPLKTAVLQLGIVFATFKLGVGEAVVAMLGWLTNAGRIVVQSARAVTSMQALSASTRLARMEWKKMETAMKTNIWGAVVAAIGLVVYNIYEHIKAVKEAAAEIGRFNQQLSNEKKALDDLFTPLQKSNLAQGERSKLISEINSKYSRYLGFMLSETNSAIQLADAHALIAKRIREEAYEKRIMDQEDKVRQRHAEDINAAYGGIENAVRDAARGDTNVQDVTDSLKRFVDSSMPRILQTSTVQAFSGTSVGKELDKRIERMVVDGKLSRKAARDVYRAVASYAKEARSQAEEMQRATANSRADLRNTQREIAGDINANLNDLVKNIKDFGRSTPTVTAKPAPQQNLWQPQWGQQSINWQGTSGTQANVQVPLPSDRPQIDRKNIGEVKKYVEYQDQLRGYLQANAEHIDEQTRKTAEMYLESEEEMKKLRALLPKDAGSGSGSGGNGGGSGINPYGSYNRVTSPYQDWDADTLVNRRKEMLERVRALANGADVQAVLSEDAKFISEATRKNIKDTKQAIEWYNTERLKIQDALHEKHLTNTGDWMDPTKQKARAKVIKDEWSAYLNELDAYYTERKAKIQEQQNDEEISEAEARNRTLANEAEWRQRRAELQKLYARKSAEVTEEEQQAIFDIISERTGDTADFIQKTIGKTVKFIYDIGKHSEAEQRTIFGKLDKGIEQDLLRQRNAIGQHMKDITAIINKENPYAGITEELRKNLGTMDALLTDIEKDEERTVDKEIERTMFILEQSTKGYALTWEELMREMAKRGWQAWADAVNGDTQTREQLMHQVYRVFEKVQDAIKKEASQLKKDADIMWSNILLPGGDGKTTIKDVFEQTIGALGIEEGRVSRANSLIGAGQASERVADRLAIQQMKVQLAMQQYQYSLVRKIGREKIESLRKEAREAEAIGDIEKARQARMQAQNAEMALNLATRKEQTEELKQQEAIIAKTEESEARLYKELKSWADLLASSLQSIFEASHAGDKEYYNELAKLNLTGKGGPGAGTYIVIDNEGTSDATAHYEYLDEREALERQHEIERENAMADAWKKVMDDINMKMSETITDQLNAMLQNASLDANTKATIQNTQAMLGLTGAMGGDAAAGIDTSLGSSFGLGTSGEGGSTAGSGGDLNMPPTVSDADPESYERYAKWVETYNAGQESMGRKTKDTNTKIQQSTQSMFAKMTAAANLYGIAYQAMSNDNMSTEQKFGMIAVQAAGQSAIAMMSAQMFKSETNALVSLPEILAECLEINPIAGAAIFAVLSALIGAGIGVAASKLAKGKSQVAQVTGASASAGKLTTGMLTYAEGNVNEFTDPSTLREGRQYNVDAADGRTYRARYMGRNPKTHLTNGPEFHLSGERGREMIIDAGTTRQITMNEGEIWHAIQTLSGGGRISTLRRRGRGVAAFADGNLSEFSDYSEYSDTTASPSFDPAAMQASLDRNSAVQEALLERLSQPIETFVSPYGPRGIVAGYDRAKKEAQRYGVEY